MTSDHLPEISIVIRAFNEERWLPEVLASLSRQTCRDFEVLLVDSGSTDRTREIAAANGVRVIRLRSEDFTFGHSLNVGIQEARGSLVAILSAHAIPADEGWLERLVAPLRQPGVALVYGGQRGHEISKFSEARDFERIFPSQGAEVDPEHPFANNANSAIRKALWETHPFDKGLPGLEDIEWAKYWMNNGHKVLYEPAACIIHVHTESWSQIRRRFHREGMAARWVGTKILRHIPGEVWRELRWCGRDLSLAVRQRQLRQFAGQILRFRYEKLFATVRGIVYSRGLSNPSRRVEMYFQKDFPAVVIQGPHRARLERRKVQNLRPGEVLVRVAFVGVCGTDLEVLEGSLGYYKTGMASYPIVPGHESSGTIADAGFRVSDLSEGDRVVVECIQGCGECADCLNDEAIRCRDRQEVGVIGQDGAFAGFLVTRARYVHKIPPSGDPGGGCPGRTACRGDQGTSQAGLEAAGRPAEEVCGGGSRHDRSARGPRPCLAGTFGDGFRQGASAPGFSERWCVDGAVTGGPSPVRMVRRGDREPRGAVHTHSAVGDRSDTSLDGAPLRSAAVQLRVDRLLRSIGHRHRRERCIRLR